MQSFEAFNSSQASQSLHKGHTPLLNLGENTLNKSLPKEFIRIPIPIIRRGSPIAIL